MRNKKAFATIIGLCLLTGTTAAYAATASDYQTTEYYASKGLALLRAADAYALGYTGKGILTGVSDMAVNFATPELAGKPGSYDPESQDYNWAGMEHGTHVSGIVAASKDSEGMHGVAFDADVLGEYFDYGKTSNSLFRDDLFTNFLNKPEIKVINCSWGWPQNSLDTDLGTKTDGGSIVNFAYMTSADIVKEYPYLTKIQEAANANKLLVFAAGNSGHTTQAYTKLAFMWQNPTLSNNYLEVSAADNLNLTASSDGSIKGDHLVTYFSDLAKFAEDNFVAASGQEIYSANADYYVTGNAHYGKLDIPMNGTSMAAPHVTGVAALVQQAFPYMSAKQIGDVLLSTANSNITLPAYQVMLSKKEQGYKLESMTIIFSGAPSGKTEAELKQLAKDYYQSYYANNGYYSKGTWDMCVDRKLTALYYAGLQEFWGQGLVDAGKAVQGLGALNARRLTADNISADYTVLGTKTAQALYPIDTQGYNSIWRNDIKEIKVGLIAPDSTESDLKDRYQYYYYNWIDGNSTATADTKALTQSYIDLFNDRAKASGLQGLSVGLWKQGDGTLALTGANTYKGSTVVGGGAIALTGSVAGDAYTLSGGTLTGTGTVNGNLDNKGTLTAGLTSTAQNLLGVSDPAGTLSVKGSLTSSGALQLIGKSKVAVTGTAAVGGTSVALVATPKNNPLINQTYNYLTAAGGVTGLPALSGANPSAFVQLTTSATDATHAYFTPKLLANANLNTTAGLTDAEKQLYTALNQKAQAALQNSATSQEQAQLYSDLYYLTPGAGKQLATDLTGTNPAQLLNQSPLSYLTADTVYSRLDTTDLDGTLTTTVQAASLDGDAPRVKTTLPVSLDAKNNLWFKLFRGTEAYNGTADLTNNSFGGAIGYDRALNLTTRVGGLFSYGTTHYSMTKLSGDSHDWRLGVYADHKNGAWEYQGLVSYGQNHYDMDRNVDFYNTKLNGDYKAKVWDAEAKAKYTLPSTVQRTWQVKPYGKLSYTHTSQDSYTESSNTVLPGQSVDSLSNNSWRGEVGLELKRNNLKYKSGWGGTIGYKRILSGANPELNGTLSGSDSGFTLTSDNDKDYVTYSLNAHTSLGGRWTGQAEFKGEKSQNNHKEIYSVVAKYAF